MIQLLFIRLRILLILVFLFLTTTVQARELALKDCIKYALENHPKVMIIKKDLELVINNYKIIKSKRSVQLAASLASVETAKSTTGAVSVAGKDTDLGLMAGLSAAYSIYDPRQSDSEKTARLNIDLTKLKNQAALHKIKLDLKNAYFEYLRTIEDVDFKKQNLKNVKFNLDLTKKQFKAGYRSLRDLTVEKIKYENNYLDFLRAKRRLHEKKLAFYSAMGVDDLKIDIKPKKITKLPKIKYSVEDLFKLAKLYNTNIQIYNIKIRKTKVAISMAKGARYPTTSITISLGVRHRNLFNPPPTTWDDKKWQSGDENPIEPVIGFVVNFHWPIYTGGRISTHIDNAVINYNKALYSKRDVLMNIKNAIVAQIVALEDLKKQMVLQKMNNKNAENFLKLTQKSYIGGYGTQQNLSNAQLNVLGNRLREINIKYEYLKRLAILSNILGLNEENLCK